MKTKMTTEQMMEKLAEYGYNEGASRYWIDQVQQGKMDFDKVTFSGINFNFVKKQNEEHANFGKTEAAEEQQQETMIVTESGIVFSMEPDDVAGEPMSEGEQEAFMAMVEALVLPPKTNKREYLNAQISGTKADVKRMLEDMQKHPNNKENNEYCTKEIARSKTILAGYEAELAALEALDAE